MLENCALTPDEYALILRALSHYKLELERNSEVAKSFRKDDAARAILENHVEIEACKKVTATVNEILCGI